jgi:hypothetical protein
VIIDSLRLLFRCLGAVESDHPISKLSLILGRQSRRIRIRYSDDKGEITVSNLSWDDKHSNPHTFELNDPRSVVAIIRSGCRRLGMDVPSFERVSEMLEEGPPAWMLEEG